MPVVAAVVAIIATGVQLVQAEEEKSDRKKAERERADQARKNALAEQRIASKQVSQQLIVEQEAASREMDDNRRRAQGAVASAQVVAGERGAFGASFDALINDFQLQESRFEANVESNISARQAAAATSLEGIQAQTEGALFNAQVNPVPDPNYANFALSGLSTYFSLEQGFTRGKASAK